MIHLSKAAAGEIKRLQSNRHNSDAKVRLSIQSGGCADFFYTIEFDEVLKESDLIYNCSDIPVVVDVQSLNYINDLTLDYSEDLMGSGFRFHNPNAVQSCGCGNSFSVEQKHDVPQIDTDCQNLI